MDHYSHTGWNIVPFREMRVFVGRRTTNISFHSFVHSVHSYLETSTFAHSIELAAKISTKMGMSWYQIILMKNICFHITPTLQNCTAVLCDIRVWPENGNFDLVKIEECLELCNLMQRDHCLTKICLLNIAFPASFPVCYKCGIIITSKCSPSFIFFLENISVSV